jgi:integral membrane protein
MRPDRRFVGLLATLAVAETASLLVLGGAMVSGSHDAVTVIGAVHGVIWLLYAWLILAMISLKMWRKKEAVRVVVCALLPMGSLYTAHWCSRLLLEDALRQHQQHSRQPHHH